MMDFQNDHGHDHGHDHDHDHDHGHAHDHDHDHDHAGHSHEHGGGSLEAREKQIVMSFIEALVEERLSVNARRAVFGILSLDPRVRDASV